MKRQVTILAVTTSRADYGLLYPLLVLLRDDPGFKLELVALGSHLSSLHGQTKAFIEADGFALAAEIETVPTEDTEHATCVLLGQAIQQVSALYERMKPDAILMLGDRYELWAAALPAVIHNIPMIHLHGGETTEGAIDEAVRHSISKMAAIHFPSIEAYAQRLIQMGEHPDRVHVVGAIGLDNIRNLPLLSPAELSQSTGVDFVTQPVALMTYHPVTLDLLSSGYDQVSVVLEALLETDLHTLITMPNADTGGQAIFQQIQLYTQHYPHRFTVVKSLGQQRYLSAMRHARLMIGNSSSGIIESASFQLPVVNIGDRQAGRFRPPNVIDCDVSLDGIRQALTLALSDAFLTELVGLQNPYGDGNASTKIMAVLRAGCLSNKLNLLKKQFYQVSLPAQLASNVF